jgi:RNA polymerase sigma-70 factor, ECF subfamily
MIPVIPVEHQMLASIPRLRAFAISLTRDRDRADDLVQGTLLNALSCIDKFSPGTNMNAWLFTILRNKFMSECRRRRKEIEDPEGVFAERIVAPPDQGQHLDIADLRAALHKLSLNQREALLLVAADGISYEEAARICGTCKGTMKSRVHRARTRLAEVLAIEPDEEMGPDPMVKAILFAQLPL